jgi:hypothetical protein
MTTQQLEDRLVRKCPSHECNNEYRNFDYVGVGGVPWRRKFIYQCRKCHYQMKIKVQMPDDRGRI